MKRGIINMKNYVRLFLMVILGLILVSGCGDSETNTDTDSDGETSDSGDVITIKLGHGGASGDILHQTVDLLSEYVEEQTDGKYIIENYGASQLGNERDLIE